jgi:toxin ParE1/3/4
LKRIRLSPQAETDLETIADYIASDNPVRAMRFVQALRARCESLGAHPWQGRAAPAISPEARVIVFRSYLILYRIEEAVEIIRFVHGARDLDTALADEP